MMEVNEIYNVYNIYSRFMLHGMKGDNTATKM